MACRVLTRGSGSKVQLLAVVEQRGQLQSHPHLCTKYGFQEPAAVGDLACWLASTVCQAAQPQSNSSTRILHAGVQTKGAVRGPCNDMQLCPAPHTCTEV
jgi:hypothetical protein